MGGGLVKLGFAQAIDIVALGDADSVQAGQAEGFAEVMEEVAGLGVVGGLFFNENLVHQRQCLGKLRMLNQPATRARGMGFGGRTGQWGISHFWPIRMNTASTTKSNPRAIFTELVCFFWKLTRLSLRNPP